MLGGRDQPSDAAAIAAAMQRAVESSIGRQFTTGAKVPGIPTAGKSGTAELGGSGAPHSWFIGFAPADNPQVAIAVIVERGGRGGARAAPLAGDLMEPVLPDVRPVSEAARTARGRAGRRAGSVARADCAARRAAAVARADRPGRDRARDGALLRSWRPRVGRRRVDPRGDERVGAVADARGRRGDPGPRLTRPARSAEPARPGMNDSPSARINGDG